MLFPIGCLVLFSLPAIGVIWLILREWKSKRATTVVPFKELRRRPAGESTRLRLDELDLETDLLVLQLLLVPAVSMGVFVSPTMQTPGIVAFGCAISVLSAAYVLFKLRPLVRTRADYRLGFEGERYVAEELNQLIAGGVRVFHDVPFESFNLDHVLVGPQGIFVVETKTRRKPVSGSGKKEYTVVFDGNALQYPWGAETGGLEQTRRNVETLSKWLTSATGEALYAKGILTLPGWLVERKGRADVSVLNPKEIHKLFATPGEPILDAAQVKRITHQLEEKCRIAV